MAKIAGKYSEVGSKNLEKYFNKLSIPEELKQKFIASRFNIEILEEGDKLTLVLSTGLTVLILLDQEYEEDLIPGTRTISKRTNKGFEYTTTMPNGTDTNNVEYEFTDDGLLTVLSFKGVTAIRYFKREH